MLFKTFAYHNLSSLLCTCFCSNIIWFPSGSTANIANLKPKLLWSTAGQNYPALMLLNKDGSASHWEALQGSRWEKKDGPKKTGAKSFWVSISIWESLLIGDQQTFSSWALHENKKSYFLVIFKCFSLFWTMRMHVQPCVCWSKYTTDFTAAVLSLKWKVRKIILDSYLTTDVSSSSSCTVPEEEETDSKANDSKGHKGHTDNYDGDSEK